MRQPSDLKGPVLLLTNNDNTAGFHRWLLTTGCNVIKMESSLDAATAALLAPSFVVSFNYRHVIGQDALAALGCDAVNVHCSVLPWNRGASPNFFSYFENTPKGVTIHRLSAELDQGDILLQRTLSLSEDETFESSYQKLIDSACELLEHAWYDLFFSHITGLTQSAGGSYHTMADFIAVRSRYPFEWSDRVSDWKAEYGLL